MGVWIYGIWVSIEFIVCWERVAEHTKYTKRYALTRVWASSIRNAEPQNENSRYYNYYNISRRSLFKRRRREREREREKFLWYIFSWQFQGFCSAKAKQIEANCKTNVIIICKSMAFGSSNSSIYIFSFRFYFNEDIAQAQRSEDNCVNLRSNLIAQWAGARQTLDRRNNSTPP